MCRVMHTAKSSKDTSSTSIVISTVMLPAQITLSKLTTYQVRENYKTRLQVLFREYPSINFGGRSWGELNEVILGVDVQNQPWANIWPIVSGESWLCDVAEHLKHNLGLGRNNIAVISGGISAPQTLDGIQNYPDSAFKCKAIDVIGIHGYFPQEDEGTAGTNWAKMFVPGNTLTARAKGEGKLLLVEEMSYVHTEHGLHYKQAAIWDQGNALNYRGIPWLYSKLNNGGEGTTPTVSILRDDNSAVGALKNILKRAYTSRSNFDWSKYLSPPPALSNITHVVMNPYTPEQSDCTFGCPGLLCDDPDGCAPDLICKNSICVSPSSSKQPGKIGDSCNSKTPCLEHLTCSSGQCQECVARPSLQPPSIRAVLPNDFRKSCELDTTSIFKNANLRFCAKPPPFTSPSRRGNPCTNAAHCDANEFCDWGTCKACTASDGGCLGTPCRSNNKCKTGFCNTYGYCDYPGLKKHVIGPGARAKARSGPMGPGTGPKGQRGGPNKVVDQAVRIRIPEEGVEATGTV
ncbi:glycoside hydrolase family 5 protein [Sporormia fimetaria CBS 119925]|uniref:Glycoside hydrolase family 5 protein n=1 Tax=Sporormia fimetaria CBS 119925 TaxID=1340428 RepID=A0A6A6V8C6_9PLEO|nr:glycoside hydrolase family 5 protein [Sporormia fimetaria CBS 119925]